jgi:hypothetical protein
VDNLIYKNVIRIPFGTISGFVNCEFILLLILRDKYIVLTMDHIRHKQAYQTKNFKKMSELLLLNMKYLSGVTGLPAYCCLGEMAL